MKGVIPAAGLGTRLLPATLAQPKEMLPLVDKPTIQYVVEEAAASGLSEVVIVVGPTKASIRNHFSADAHVLDRFEAAGKLPALAETLDLVRRIPVRFVTQKAPRGLGDAIYQARHAVGNEPFAVLLGDDIILSKGPATRALMRRHDKSHPSVVGVQRLPRKQLKRYGVIEPASSLGPLHHVRNLVEKPAPGTEPSDLGVVGRYVLSPGIFDAIRKTSAGRGGEIQLTDALRRLLKREPIFALELEGQRLDVGGKLEWLQANVALGLRDPKLAPQLRAYLRGVLGT